jgi:hypothetical protein
MFAVCAAAVSTVYPALVAHTGGQGLPCPLRTLTGVPCPFCGMTTATVAITHGRWGAAASANPLAYLAAALLACTAPVLVARAAGWVASPTPWSATTIANRTTLSIIFPNAWSLSANPPARPSTSATAPP